MKKINQLICLVVFGIVLIPTVNALSCGSTIYTSFNLTYDMAVCTGYGIIIGADDVTLNCKGHEIRGNNALGGILAIGKRDIKIQNCRVENFQYGIRIAGSRNSEILGNSLTNNHYGIYLGGNTDNITVSGNTIHSRPESTSGIDVSHEGDINKIYGNALFTKGINHNSWTLDNNTYCIGVGNLYVGGAAIQRPHGDCGPMPNVGTFSINPSHTGGIGFSEETSGVYYTSASVQEVIGNTNYNSHQTIYLEPNTGPYSANLIFPYLKSTTLDCGGNILQGSGGGVGIYLVESPSSQITNCRIEDFGFGIRVTQRSDSRNIGINGNALRRNGVAVFLEDIMNVGILNVDIHSNDFENNTGYNIQNTQKGYINAQNNWWGTIDPIVIEDKIYHQADHANVGAVTYIPYFEEPNISPLEIVKYSVPDGILNEYMAYRFETEGGYPPYFYSISGELAPGMDFTDSGLLQGIPTKIGSYNFTVSVTDSGTQLNSKNVMHNVHLEEPKPKLKLKKFGTIAIPGRNVVYVILVTNKGELPSKNNKVTEVLEPWFTFVSSNPDPTAIVSSNRERVIWHIPDLEVNESVIITYKVALSLLYPGTNAIFPEDSTVRGPACAQGGGAGG